MQAIVVLHRIELWITPVYYRGFTQSLSWFHTDPIVVSHRFCIISRVFYVYYQYLMNAQKS